MKIALITNAGGGQLQTCLLEEKFRSRIQAVISDKADKNLEIAKSHGIQSLVARGETSSEFNEALSVLMDEYKFDALISFGFTRLFSAAFLASFKGTVFNSHFSLLPSFPGKRGADWTTNVLPPKAIFERAILYGARFIGNTIHIVDQSIDGGRPVMQSCLPVPYEYKKNELRHELFIQECRCLMQFALWLSDRRILISENEAVVANASFDQGWYSPALEEEWIKSFTPVNRAAEKPL